MSVDLEHQIQENAKHLYRLQKKKRKGPKWDQRITWLAAFPKTKILLFQFIDTLPQLKNNKQRIKLLLSYLKDSNESLAYILRFLLRLALILPLGSFVFGLILNRSMKLVGRQFMLPLNLYKPTKVLEKLWKQNIAFTIDMVGEMALTEAECLAYLERYESILKDLVKESPGWNTAPTLESTIYGPLPRVNVSIKLSSLVCHIKPLHFDSLKPKLVTRVKKILDLAVQHKVSVTFDMEHNDFKPLIYEIAEQLFLDPAYKSYPHFGLVLQAYQPESIDDLQWILNLAKTRQTPIHLRLVKGAYWDFETILAAQRHWKSPVFENKYQSDAQFEKLTDVLLNNLEFIRPAFATHNLRSVAQVLAKLKSKNLDSSCVEFQFLHGMSSGTKRALAEMGYRVRDYVAFGELLPGMAYLIRRLLENSSNQGFLVQLQSKKIDPLIQNPNLKGGVL